MTIPAEILAGLPADDAPGNAARPMMEDPGVTLDDIGSALAQPAAGTPNVVDLSTKLDGENVPEAWRGLTMGEVLQRAEGAREVIQRMNREPAAPAPAPAPRPVEVPAQPAARPLPQIDPDEYDRLNSEDPKKAIAYAMAVAEARADVMFTQRIQPLLGNVASTAEHQARTRYQEVFQVIGDEIDAVVNALPDKTVLANAAAWDQLIPYVKGRSQKWEDHIVAKRTQSNGTPPGPDPREVAAAASLNALPPRVPPSPTNGQPRTGPGFRGQLTEEQRENIKVMGITEEEWRRNWA